MIIRAATIPDAGEISAFLQEMVVAGTRNLPSDKAFVQDHYIDHPDTILCSVAEEADGRLVALQILKRASEGNPYGVTPGWGIVGTHVKPGLERRGIGRSLFAQTNDAARTAGLKYLDASIGAKNPEGLGYYDAMGFQTYRSTATQIRKRFEVC